MIVKKHSFRLHESRKPAPNWKPHPYQCCSLIMESLNEMPKVQGGVGKREHGESVGHGVVPPVADRKNSSNLMHVRAEGLHTLAVAASSKCALPRPPIRGQVHYVRGSRIGRQEGVSEGILPKWPKQGAMKQRNVRSA